MQNSDFQTSRSTATKPTVALAWHVTLEQWAEVRSSTIVLAGHKNQLQLLTSAIITFYIQTINEAFAKASKRKDGIIVDFY